MKFQVDDNQNGVPWTVTRSRNGNAIASFTATTRAPSVRADHGHHAGGHS